MTVVSHPCGGSNFHLACRFVDDAYITRASLHDDSSGTKPLFLLLFTKIFQPAYKLNPTDVP